MSTADKSAALLASWFGCGKSPIAPGTVGSLGALPLHLLLRSLGPVPYWTGTALIAVLGVWASERVCKSSGEKDPQWVVIDEVAGTLIAMGLVRRRSLAVRLAALLIFRALDIAKPGPVDRAQHLKPEGLGVMADDLLAGLAAGLMARWL
ncbi:MAG TPA: phosphatidylglycerophosphatase A [Polyangiaceae bacterium]|nr:phosphatidylglycerophosphatase A [Polyangiaceae bacterium]